MGTATVTSIGTIRLRAGEFYHTRGGSLIFIQKVEAKIASGFFVRGHLFSQWKPTGQYVSCDEEHESDNDINSEVMDHENRNICGYCKRKIPRGPDSRQLHVA